MINLDVIGVRNDSPIGFKSNNVDLCIDYAFKWTDLAKDCEIEKVNDNYICVDKGNKFEINYVDGDNESLSLEFQGQNDSSKYNYNDEKEDNIFLDEVVDDIFLHSDDELVDQAFNTNREMNINKKFLDECPNRIYLDHEDKPTNAMNVDEIDLLYETNHLSW